MKPTLYILTICLFTSGLHAQQSPANIRLKDVTLMHEMRATPSPLDKAVVADRIVSFQWPLQEGLYVVESGLDGLDTKHKIDKSKVRYSLRYSQDPTFKTGVMQVETRWPFFNPEMKIKDVYLTVVNSDDVMATKALMSGLVNQVPVEGIGNMNFTSLMEVMFKGSAYVLCGELPHRFGTNEHMMLKIPMSAENEMESQYSISDIEIGKVTVLGIYRGEFDRRDVERKINRMMALNDSGKKNQQETNDIQDSGMDIEDGVREEDKNGIRNISLAQGKVHYIDVIAIIQDINI